jgi:hypothetical protein
VQYPARRSPKASVGSVADAVSTLTGLERAVELGDWHRFRPQSLGPFLGLTPSEHSPGGATQPRRDHQDR